MRSVGLIVIAWLHLIVAQRWAIDQGCNPWGDQISRAASDGIKMARIALNVLDNYGNDEKVRSMITYILGNDGNVADKLSRARASIYGVASFRTEEVSAFELAQPGGRLRHTDIVFVCNANHLEQIRTHPVPVFLSHITQRSASLEAEPQLLSCFDPNRREMETSIAITRVSDVLHPAYKAKVDENAAQGLPPPFDGDYLVPVGEFPSTIDLCFWYLRALTSGLGRLVTITDEAIARVAQPGFAATLRGNLRPIDYLLETMSCILNHEFTHTRVGGFAIDAATPQVGCYGWYCVGIIRNPLNADTINVLIVCLWLFSKGYWVDNYGNVLRI